MSRSLALKIEAANTALLVNGDVKSIGEFFAQDYVAHLTDQDVTGGHGTIRKILELYRRAFTDLQVEVEILVAAKDRVAWQRTLRASHVGSFKGFPGTDRVIVWREMVTSRFRDGLIVEEWFLTDLAERLLLGRKGLRAKGSVGGYL
jgi:steroid delta-isomerase-like uncharacterized protein